MPQYFLDSPLTIGTEITISGEDYHHMVNVRRASLQQDILLRDVDKKSYLGKITAIEKDEICLKIIEEIQKPIMPYDITLCMALIKGKKFDLVIQKAVEVGVSRIIPVITKRAVPDVKKKGDKKIERWTRVAEEAAKQSRQGKIPVIEDIITLEDLMESETGGLRLIAHTEEGSSSLSEVIGKHSIKKREKSSRAVTLLVGPEGGFAPEEIKYARENNWEMFYFGYSQLKAETAAIVFPAIIINELDRINNL